MVAVLVVLVTAGAAALLAAAQPARADHHAGAGRATAAPADSDLYVQQAEGGTLTGSRLVLRGVSPQTTSFADRPLRASGVGSTAAFVAGWAQTFGDDPPNAALQMGRAPQSRDVAELELRAPRYDPRKRTLTYTVRRLPSTGSSASGGPAQRSRSGTRSFGRATLFIDDGTSPEFNVTIMVSGTGPATVSLALNNATFDYNAPSNPTTGTTVSVGGATGPTGVYVVGMLPAQLTVNLPPGVSQPLSATLLTVITAPASGNVLTGTASVPAGVTVQLLLGPTPVPIANGPFSIPLQ